MKTPLLSLLAVFAAINLKSQSVSPQVLSSTGGTSQSSGGAIEWTIGEPVSDTYASSDHITTMGFHQPVLTLVNAVNELKMEGQFLVYPNPVHDELMVNFEGLRSERYTISVTDAAGRLVLSREFTSSDVSQKLVLQLDGLAQGNYILNVSSAAFTKSVKVNKIQ